MPNEPRFKTLRPYKDPISAREWNKLTQMVTVLCRSLSIDGIFDSSGLHIRRRPPKAAEISYGVAYETTPWSPTQYDGKYVKLHPCGDEKGANEDTSTIVKVYVFTPVYDKNGDDASLAPDGLEVYQNDVVAYVSICDDDEGNAQGILLDPPLRLPPEGLKYQVMQKDSDTDYGYSWDWLRFTPDASPPPP